MSPKDCSNEGKKMKNNVVSFPNNAKNKNKMNMKVLSSTSMIFLREK
jgi:hypothetical protein